MDAVLHALSCEESPLCPSALLCMTWKMYSCREMGSPFLCDSCKSILPMLVGDCIFFLSAFLYLREEVNIELQLADKLCFFFLVVENMMLIFKVVTS